MKIVMMKVSDDEKNKRIQNLFRSLQNNPKSFFTLLRI